MPAGQLLIKTRISKNQVINIDIGFWYKNCPVGTQSQVPEQHNIERGRGEKTSGGVFALPQCYHKIDLLDLHKQLAQICGTDSWHRQFKHTVDTESCRRQLAQTVAADSWQRHLKHTVDPDSWHIHLAQTVGTDRWHRQHHKHLHTKVVPEGTDSNISRPFSILDWIEPVRRCHRVGPWSTQMCKSSP